MSQTPSKRRRDGRRAFCPDVDPMDIQPYNKNSFDYEGKLKDWLKGWEQEKAAYVETIPCTLCGNSTDMLETTLCNTCWELKTRIENNSKIAKKILEEMKNN